MKIILRLLFLTFFAAGALLITACDGSKSDPTPTMGVIEGKVSPANTITAVTATNDAKEAFKATLSTTGEYSISNLPAGKYVVSFTAAQGFTPPADQTLTVTAGQTSKAADVTVQSSAGDGSWKVDNATTNTSATFVLGTLQFNNLTVIMSNTTAGQTVTFSLDNFTGATGTFTAGGYSLSQLMFSQHSGNTANQWTASFLGGNGSITVTSVGTNPRRISGTFTGTLAPATSTATGNKTLTGSFTNIQY